MVGKLLCSRAKPCAGFLLQVPTSQLVWISLGLVVLAMSQGCAAGSDLASSRGDQTWAMFRSWAMASRPSWQNCPWLFSICPTLKSPGTHFTFRVKHLFIHLGPVQHPLVVLRVLHISTCQTRDGFCRVYGKSSWFCWNITAGVLHTDLPKFL